MQLYAGSYGHRFSDAQDTLVGFTAESVQSAVDEAVEYELNELALYCEHATVVNSALVTCTESGYCALCGSDTCSLCNADIVTYGVWPVYRVSDLGGLRRTIDIIKELRENLPTPSVVSIGD